MSICSADHFRTHDVDNLLAIPLVRTPIVSSRSQVQYKASHELRLKLEAEDDQAERKRQQSIAQSLVSLGNLYAELANLCIRHGNAHDLQSPLHHHPLCLCFHCQVRRDG